MEWQTKIWEYLIASGLPSLLLGVGCRLLWVELKASRAETKAAQDARIEDLRSMLKQDD